MFEDTKLKYPDLASFSALFSIKLILMFPNNENFETLNLLGKDTTFNTARKF